MLESTVVQSSLSIVIPAYNVENYIDEAIDSVIQQTIAPHEIIVVDDGSTDNTPKKLVRYASHPLIKLSNIANVGPGQARNHGRSLATGEYIYYFDSDDRLATNFVESMERIIREHDKPDIIFFSGESFFDKGFTHSHFPDYQRKINGVLDRSQSPIRTMIQSRSLFASPCLYISKKSLWDQNGLAFAPIIHEDEEIIFPLMACANRVYITKDNYFFRRVRPDSIMTRSISPKNLEAMLFIVSSLSSFVSTHPDLVWRDNDLWVERIKGFTFAYIFMSKSLGFRVYYRHLVRPAITVNQLHFYGHILFHLMSRRKQLIIKRLLKR